MVVTANGSGVHDAAPSAYHEGGIIDEVPVAVGDSAVPVLDQDTVFGDKLLTIVPKIGKFDSMTWQEDLGRAYAGLVRRSAGLSRALNLAVLQRLAVVRIAVQVGSTSHASACKGSAALKTHPMDPATARSTS
jgi:hypothetical protein